MGIQSEENYGSGMLGKKPFWKNIYTNTKILKVEQTYVVVTFRG